MGEFFVNRPIVAMVISIIMVLLGLVAMSGLPVAQYPEIVPPMVQVTTTFVGASATDVEALLHLVRPYPAEAMVAYPVAPLLGKAGSGNSERASLPFEYPELILADPLA